MTLIYQSYRTHHVPHWIERCLASVKSWAEKRGFTYCFIDDELFKYAPSWYREKVEGNVQLVSDLSRLILARKFLQQGYQQVIWIDADMLIFDPENFSIQTDEGVYFCRETWVDADPEGNIIHQKKVNNSISVFHRQNTFLEFYIDACQKMVKQSKGRPPHVLVGTSFLTHLHKMYPLSLLGNVGIISPALVHDLFTQQTHFIEKYLEWQGSSIHAANLCGSMKDKCFKGTELNEKSMEAVVEKLLQNRDLLSIAEKHTT